MLDSIKSVLVPIHREGHKFVAIFAAITFILFLIWNPLGWIGVVLTLWCAYFFRDPERVVPNDNNLVVSPADGVVNLIKIVVPPKELDLGDEEMLRVTVFMNVFNVHVNRMPLSGQVMHTTYVPGKFLSADLDKASEQNERQAIKLETKDGLQIGVVQIAGLVARRILCEAREGDVYEKGHRFGLIRFGSRVDVYVPKKYKAKVALGQTAIAGETILFDLNGDQAELTSQLI